MKDHPVETLGGEVKVIHVKNDEELECNVEYVEIEQGEVLDGGIVALTADGTKWIPFEVNLTSDIVDNEVVIEFTENEEEIIETTPEEDTVENIQATQVLIIEDGSFAYIQESENEVTLSNSGESTEVTIKTDPLIDEKSEKNKAKIFACREPGCNRTFSRRHHLKVHNRYHTGLRPFECTAEGCNKSFSTFHSRKAHLRTHTGEAPYACTYDSCIKRFKTSGDLQKHIRVHTGERPFACPFVGCNKFFTTSNIRKVHIRTHTGEKPYECTHEGCNKRFASSTNFKNHKRIHAGIKPFCCKVPNCLKRFTEYSSLYKHQLVHSQQKKHQCNICQKTYRQTSTLTTHKRTAHGVISAEDGTEIVIEDMIGLGGTRSKNFKDITSKLLKLKKDCNIVTISEDGSPLYTCIVSSTDVESVNVNDLVEQTEIV